MKKLFLTLIAIAATSFASLADTSLEQAYKAISSMKGMTERSVGTANVGDAEIGAMKTSAVSVSGDAVIDYRKSVIYELENLPIRNIVIGANNQREMASVYAEPAGQGLYNVLIVTANCLDGNFSASLGKTDAAGVKAIRNCNLEMDSAGLVVSTSEAPGAPALITMTF